MMCLIVGMPYAPFQNVENGCQIKFEFRCSTPITAYNHARYIYHMVNITCLL